MNDIRPTPPGFDCWVTCVPTGTVVGLDDDGEEMVVTETSIVNIGNQWWCTQKFYDQIRQKSVARMN